MSPGFDLPVSALLRRHSCPRKKEDQKLSLAHVAAFREVETFDRSVVSFVGVQRECWEAQGGVRGGCDLRKNPRPARLPFAAWFSDGVMV